MRRRITVTLPCPEPAWTGVSFRVFDHDAFLADLRPNLLERVRARFGSCTELVLECGPAGVRFSWRVRGDASARVEVLAMIQAASERLDTHAYLR